MNSDNGPPDEHLPPVPTESPPPYEPPLGIDGHGRNPWGDVITIKQYADSLAKHIPEILPRAR